jgi:hypothetical protein
LVETLAIRRSSRFLRCYLPACTAAGLVCDYITKGPALSHDRLVGSSLYAGGIRLVIIFADGYTQLPSQDVPGKGFGPTWMTPAQEQDLENFVLGGGSVLLLHNSMWGCASPSTRQPCALNAACPCLYVLPKLLLPLMRCAAGTLVDPIKPHSEYDAVVMLQELRDVQAVLSASTRPMTAQEAGLCDVRQMGPFRRLCGAVGGYHPAFEPHTYTVVDSEHPIARGLSAQFTLYDEQHYTVIDAHRGAKLFLTSRGQDGRETCAGHSFEHGRGRVAYLAPGHVPLVTQPRSVLPKGQVDSLNHPAMQLLLHNAVQWLVRSPSKSREHCEDENASCRFRM